MKITILYDTWEGTEEYPGETADLARKGKKLKRPKLDREEIAAALTKLDHEVDMYVLDGHDASLSGLMRKQADLFFNLTESYGGDDSKDLHLAAFLELVGKRYTGGGVQALCVAQDKVLAKKIVGFHGLHTPFFAVSHRGRFDLERDIQFPMIVKPSSADGSKGIDIGSVVTSVKELMERIDYIEKEFDCPSLIEEFIEGREIYVAVLGNDRPEALPLIELDLSKLPEGMPRIAGYEVKFERDHEAYKLTKSGAIEDLDEERTKEIQEVALTAYSALKMRDYARIDLRVSPKGQIYVIEANPNPWLSSSAEFAMAARASGRTYNQTIGEIVELAAARYGRGGIGN
ncbi:MAG TPA: ATP-grasp domain-containing protein [Thermoanaerobaculia bacterium]|nr:ATP-grasp domain-containing protein [Thermoanaerobaculia bacterium]